MGVDKQGDDENNSSVVEIIDDITSNEITDKVLSENEAMFSDESPGEAEKHRSKTRGKWLTQHSIFMSLEEFGLNACVSKLKSHLKSLKHQENNKKIKISDDLELDQAVVQEKVLLDLEADQVVADGYAKASAGQETKNIHNELPNIGPRRVAAERQPFHNLVVHQIAQEQEELAIMVADQVIVTERDETNKAAYHVVAADLGLTLCDKAPHRMAVKEEKLPNMAAHQLVIPLKILKVFRQFAVMVRGINWRPSATTIMVWFINRIMKMIFQALTKRFRNRWLEKFIEFFLKPVLEYHIRRLVLKCMLG